MSDIKPFTTDEIEAYRKRVMGETAFPGGAVPAGLEKAKAAMDSWHARNAASLVELTSARAEIARLQAIVERLPVTADGVRVLPPTTVWMIDKELGPDPVEANFTFEYALESWRAYAPEDTADANGYVVTKQVVMCYSTRDAAAAARSGGEGKS